MSATTTHFSDYDGSGMDAKTYGELHTFLLLQARIERRGDGLDDAQAAM